MLLLSAASNSCHRLWRAASVCRCLGATLPAQPAAHCASENGEPGYYLLNLESSDLSNLSADLGSLGFRSGEGISPGRALRVIHAIIRACLLTFGMASAAVAEIDRKIDDVHRHIVRDALDVSFCAVSSMCVERREGDELVISLAGVNDDAPEMKPILATNDLELVTLAQNLGLGEAIDAS